MGKLTEQACNLTKKVNKPEQLTFLSINLAYCTGAVHLSKVIVPMQKGLVS
jgi:hypothetical protein